MQVFLLKFCEYVVKQENGRHSLIGLFDDIRVAALPVDHPPFFLVAQVSFTNAEVRTELKVEFRLVEPDGTIGMQLESPLRIDQDPDGEGPTLFLSIGIGGMRLQRAGIYQVQMFVDGELRHSEPLAVKVVKASR